MVELKHLTKSYGDKLVLRDIDFALERGEKVAFLGRNGEGKSTLSKIIAGIESWQGERNIGHNVSIGYYAQHQAEELDPRLNVLETLDAVATGDVRTKLRTLLGAFLFHGDEVFKPVAVLSGGEKSRLALAKLLLEPVNLIILDEPTNHLDMASKKVLKEALVEFDGALILVSHDRDFLSGLADKCVEFRHHGIKEFLGGIEGYLARRQVTSVDDAFIDHSAPRRERGGDGFDDGKSRKEQKRKDAELRNQRHAATKELKKKIAEIEKRIGRLEEERTVSEAALAEPATYSDPARTRELQLKLKEISRQLSESYGAWESHATELEQIEAAIQ